MNLLQTVKNNVPCTREPYFWSTFILPSGEFVRIDQIDWDSKAHNEDNYFPSHEHEDLAVYLNDYCGTNIKWGDGTDFVLAGAIKLNITYPYVVLPKDKPTKAQLYALELWLKQVPEEANFDADFEAGNLDMPLYIEILETSQKFYDLAVYRPSDIIDAIEDSYKVGQLVESNSKRLSEEFDQDVYNDLEEKLIDLFYSLSEAEILSYYDKGIETGGGAVWILPDGKTIELDLHSDFCSEVFYKFCRAYFKEHPEYSEDYDENDFALEDAFEYNDRLVDYFDWVKYNSGTIYDERCYVCIPQKITDKQYRVLEDIIDESAKNGCPDLLVLPQDSRQNKYYDLTIYSGRDIIKKIRNYYVSHILEESNNVAGVRFYLGRNGKKIGGLFTATGKLLKKLWNKDDEHYDDINYHLSQLEDLFDVPDLDYKNNNYNFAFKKSFITDEIREIIDDLNFYLNGIGYEVIEETTETTNIEYEDDIQFAYKINESNLTEVTEHYNGMIFTDSPYTIRDYCVNRPDAYRILYDANIDLYMLCDASLHIHWDLINQAFDLGYYSNFKDNTNIDPIVIEYLMDRDLFNYTDIGCDGFYDNGDECVELGQYLMYAIWVPKGMNENEIDNSPSSDGYDDEFEFPAGSLFTRGLDTDLMRKVDLINILRKSQPAKLTENVSESFLAKLIAAWDKTTCHPAYVNKWSETNPAAGQCLVTALVVQDELGGDIYDCKVGRSRHFYNVVNGETIDLTFNQFPKDAEITDARIRDRKQLLANKETRQRYEILKSKIGEVKQMTEAFNSKEDIVELEYIDLPIVVQSNKDRDGQWNEREVLKRFTFTVNKEDIITKILENYISDEDIPGGLKGYSDAAIVEFIRNNFDTLFDKYYDNLLDCYEDSAIEACEEEYGWDDYMHDEADDYADYVYDSWRDSQFESKQVEKVTTKLVITEDWDINDTEFIDYVLNQFNEFLKSWPVKPYDRDIDIADVDILISRFLTKGLTEEKVQQVINEMETYLDYSGVELDDDVDLNHGSIWDWTDKYTHYLIVEQNFAEVLDTVGYDKATKLVQTWKQSNVPTGEIKTENLINREEPPYYNFNEFWFFVAKHWFDCEADYSALKDAFDYGMSHPEATFNDCPVFYDMYNHEGEYLELAFEAGQESADFII